MWVSLDRPAREMEKQLQKINKIGVEVRREREKKEYVHYCCSIFLKERNIWVKNLITGIVYIFRLRFESRKIRLFVLNKLINTSISISKIKNLSRLGKHISL